MKFKQSGELHPPALTIKHNNAYILSYLSHHSEELRIFKPVHNIKVKELGEQHVTMFTEKPNTVCTFCL